MPERRNDARIAGPFEGHWHGGSGATDVRITDISLGGCRFWGTGWESAGPEVQLVLTFPSLRANLPVTGVVVRSSATDMGIRFQNLTDEQKWALRKHLRDLQTASPEQ